MTDNDDFRYFINMTVQGYFLIKSIAFVDPTFTLNWRNILSLACDWMQTHAPGHIHHDTIRAHPNNIDIFVTSLIVYYH